MQAIASLSRGVGVALQGVVRGVVRNQSNTEPARAGGPEAADSRLGNKYSSSGYRHSGLNLVQGGASLNCPLLGNRCHTVGFSPKIARVLQNVFP